MPIKILGVYECQGDINIDLINISGPKKYVCTTTNIKFVCFRCSVWSFFFFVFYWFLFLGGGCAGCGDVLVVWSLCLFLFKALDWNSVLIASIDDDTS